MLTTILGRDSEIDLVSGLLGQPGVRLVSVVGPGGVGKTRLAIAVIERLAPLPIPLLDHDHERDGPDTPEALATIPSVALLLERAISTDPTFALRPENREDLAAICVAMEGMPLAIELAAPWIRVMGPAALRQHLGNRLTLLAANASHVPARHRTLRETLHWSYQLLDAREQRVLRRCAILTGSWPLIAAEAVCAIDATPEDAIGTDDLLHAIGTLIDHSLLFPAEGTANAPRFRMLDIIREFGLEMLGTSGELPAVSQALAAWCVAYAETNAPHIFGPDQIRWLDTFGHERHTMRSGALAALERGDAVSAMRISWHLGRFWLVRGHHLADHAWLERALAMDREPSDDPHAHAWGLMALGNSWFERGELLRASAGYRDASAYAADVGAAEVESGGQLNEAIVRLKLGDVPAAHASAARSLAINRARGRRASVGKDLVILADIITTEGDPASALTLLDEALAINQDLGDIRMVALTVNTLGIVAMAQGDLATARKHLTQSLGLSRQTQERRGIATSLQRLGDLDLREGHLAAARDAFLEAMVLRKEIGDRWAIFECGEGFSEAIARDQPRRAAHLRAITDRLRTLAGASPHLAARSPADPGSLPADGALIDTLIQEARRALDGPDAPAQAPAPAAPGERSHAHRQRAATRPIPALSRREREILALIVAGYQDREIAQALFLSVRTVSWHLTNIFTKLDVNSRVAAAVLALQEGLVEPPTLEE